MVNLPNNNTRHLKDNFLIRRMAIDHGVPLITNDQVCKCHAITGWKILSFYSLISHSHTAAPALMNVFFLSLCVSGGEAVCRSYSLCRWSRHHQPLPLPPKRRTTKRQQPAEQQPTSVTPLLHLNSRIQWGNINSEIFSASPYLNFYLKYGDDDLKAQVFGCVLRPKDTK